MKVCMNCRRRITRFMAFGLCGSCYAIEKIRNLYTPIEGDDISEQELELTIQEQMKCLPDWWNNDKDEE